MKVLRYAKRCDIRQFLSHNLTLVDLIKGSSILNEESNWESHDDDMFPVEITIPEELEGK